MADEKKDVELKPLTKEALTEQILESERYILQCKKQIEVLQRDIEQNTGVLQFSKHLLGKYAVPGATKDEPKKTDLEVK